jgi:carboxymethylenebutenolidase
VDYPGSEGDMPAHLYLPGGDGRRPGILVLHTAAGPGPNVEAFARRLAAEGFVTMTPDLFALHDFGPEGRTDHPLVLGDLDGALRFLRAHPSVDPSRTGVVGFSFGGRLAVLTAARHPDLRAVVAYYAVASFQALARKRPVDEPALRTRPLTELAATLRPPVLIHHGEADRMVPAAQSALLHHALLAAGRSSTLHLYAGADHLFNFALGVEAAAVYRPEADRLSWERTLAFLARHLRPISP